MKLFKMVLLTTVIFTSLMGGENGMDENQPVSEPHIATKTKFMNYNRKNKTAEFIDFSWTAAKNWLPTLGFLGGLLYNQYSSPSTFAKASYSVHQSWNILPRTISFPLLFLGSLMAYKYYKPKVRDTYFDVKSFI